MSSKQSDIKKKNGVTDSSKKFKKYSRAFAESDGDEIVISGMAGRFPNSHNVEEFKHNLYNKIDMVDDDERRWRHFNSEVPTRSGKIYDLEKFDATFFGVHFKQAHTMDPQTRILMEVAFEAVIDSGVNPRSLRGSRTGVFIGACISESEKTWFYEKVPSGGFGITGCSRAMLPNRISYALGLNGPSFLIDTACSSSMYALDTAFNAFRNGEIDAAIVGGANLVLHPYVTLQFARLGVLAQDGYCRPFDKNATGYSRSEAINCLFLQRKRDAHRIYATIVYSKTNCDGHKAEGITYPSGKQQQVLLNEFYEDIDFKPKDLGYIEAHSTGTVVGDPEECRAIENVICAVRTEPLLIGSVKSNIGHSESSSGVNSLVKVCLTFESGLIPPNINFEEVRPDIPALVDGRLKVVKDVTELKKPYIGVNSFGFGGANAHALLKSSDKEKKNNGLPDDDIPRLVFWCGRTEESVNSVLDFIGKRPLDAEYIALLHNIQAEESFGMVFRGYGVFEKNGTEPVKTISREVEHYTGIKRPIVWVFSGMGSQWPEMGASLLTIPLFRESIEKSHNVLKQKGLNLLNILTSDDPTTFDNILHSFVGIAAIQIALVDVLKALGQSPDYIIGHSVGELGCGYADGGLTSEQMISAAYFRGKVSLEIEKIKGSMAAVGLGYKKILNILPKTIDVACHNNHESCTISGPSEDISDFVTKLKADDIFAKEVPCSNIAYHSRYIAHMGPHLLKHLRDTIPEPKPRSAKWLSSSVPKVDWEQPGRNLCSAEYHTNNLLSSVLFEESFATLPNNALTIEIAPHGLLQAILKRSMTGGVHIPLTKRGNKTNNVFFLNTLGRLFNNGLTLPIQNLYPKVQFPVSRGTSGVSSLIKWDHSEDWFVTKYENMKTKSSGEKIFKFDLNSDDEEFVVGHTIDGKILIPATLYLQYVWRTFSLMYHGPSFMDIPVEFEDVKFLRATTVTPNTTIELKVMIHYGTGNFEITESGSLVVTGRINEIEKPTKPLPVNFDSNANLPLMAKKDFYKELRLRGYHYTGTFRPVTVARADGKYGKVEWMYNWVTFIDAMLQIKIVGYDTRSLLLPTAIRKLRINGHYHFDCLTKMSTEDKVYEVFSDEYQDRIVSGGVEVIGLQASVAQRRKFAGVPVLEKYEFLPNLPTPAVNVSDAARICIQLLLENSPNLKLKVVEVSYDDKKPIISAYKDAIEDLPLITGEYLLLTDKKLDDTTGIHSENGKLSTQNNCHLIIISGLDAENSVCNLDTAYKSLSDKGYLIIRENVKINLNKLILPENFVVIAVLPLQGTDEVLLFLQKMTKTLILDPIVVEVTEKDKELNWLKQSQTAISNKNAIILYTFNEKLNGLIGLVNCLRKEPDGHLVTCFYIDDTTAPRFSLEDPFYAKQLLLGLAINVYRNKQWGTYRHLKLDYDENEMKPRKNHIYGNALQRGDLSSIRWLDGPNNLADCDVQVVYSSINFRDVMLATGRLSSDVFGLSRLDQHCVLGLEFAGINMRTGRRVMSMIANGGISSYIQKTNELTWEVPDKWSLKDAASIPIVYATIYYAFFQAVDIRKGKTILIHAGTGGVGLAAIQVALSYNLEVFTTCSTPQKKEFLLKTYPKLKESNIGNSRDTSFETMIHNQTKGKGVDFVLNSLSEDKLLASVRCLAISGHFLEIGKFDMANDTKLGMNCFLREIAFHSIIADRLLIAGEEKTYELRRMIQNDIKRDIIKPLPVTVFPANEIEQGFRYLVGGKHIGKVVIQVRDEVNTSETLPVRVLSQIYFKPNLSYIIAGGLGGFGLEMADWMAIRGAKKLILSSSRGLTKDYQKYRIHLWQSYGCEVLVNTADITTLDGCRELLKSAQKLAPIGGIFNLAVALRDGMYTNQTKELFAESFAPKAVATKFLDELSRKNCPQLEFFVVFSSVSCGRGNAGQTNYGMANSVMERIIEDRARNGYPAKAIQWGAVGEVGLVADMAEDKIDMEIGGTLQQRISSCLQELDVLLRVPDSIVSSMVVAEKRVGSSGNENIIETVMNIMSLRDLKSISLGTTLSEMGMDSLMAVEIKQTLERDFELSLTPQDLRTLTFQKLQEFSDARNQDNSDDVKMILASENKLLGMELLLRNLGVEENCNEILLPLATTPGSVIEGLSPNIIIPGVEGTSGLAWNNIGPKLNNKSLVLQLHRFAELTTIKEIIDAVIENVKLVLKPADPFYLIGYSYGALIALELAANLEKAGYKGNVLLIDGAPHFLKKLTLAQLGDDFRDEDLLNAVFSSILSQIFPEESKDVAFLKFQSLNTLEAKLEKFTEYVSRQNAYSINYAKTLVMAMYRRARMAALYNLDNIEQIEAPITLIRPSEVSLQDIDKDYCLSKYTKGKVFLKVIDGNHTSMLDNPALSQLINKFDPSAVEDKSFADYIGQKKPLI